MNKPQYHAVSQEAQAVYELFSKKEGHEQMATPVNIDHIIKICNDIKPNTILEMGGGIGTLSYAVLKHSQAKVDIYEVNEFCIAALKKNLAEFEGRYTIINSYRLLPPRREYDFMIIDGGRGKAHDEGFAEAPFFYLRYIKSIGTIYVEGVRSIQLSWAYKGLRDRYIYKVKKITSLETKGGTRVDCKRSNSRFLKFINYLYWKTRDRKAIIKACQFRIKYLKHFIGD